MKLLTFSLAVALLVVGARDVAAQSAVSIDGDEIRITGCVMPENAPVPARPDLLVWSRSGLLVAAANASAAALPIGTAGAAGQIFYWLDEDLSDHAGRRVEVRGELEDFETGEIEIDREGEFTEIQLDMDGIEETVRVPTSWLEGSGTVRDAEIDIVARKIDVEDVRVLGVCP
jgi:hypothetical protein